MLQKLRHFLSATVSQMCDGQLASAAKLAGTGVANGSFQWQHEQKRLVHRSLPRSRDAEEISRRRARTAVLKEQQDTSTTLPVKTSEQLKSEYFPTKDLHTQLFNGIPFLELPTVYVRARKNNTLLSLKVKDKVLLYRSCGLEGFKNAKKKTNIAAQTTGASFAVRALKKSVKTVKVLIEGFGPGRVSALKGMQLGGLNVVSITDETNDLQIHRPKKQRRV